MLTPLSMILISALMGAMIGGGGVYLIMSLRSNPDNLDEDFEDDQRFDKEDGLNAEEIMSHAGGAYPSVSSAHLDREIADTTTEQRHTPHLFVQEHSISDSDTSDDLASHLADKISAENEKEQGETVSQVTSNFPLPVEPPYLADLRRDAQTPEQLVAPSNDASGLVMKLPEGLAVMGMNSVKESLELPEIVKPDLSVHPDVPFATPILSFETHPDEGSHHSADENALCAEDEDHWVKHLRKVAHSTSELPEPVIPALPRFSGKN